MNHIAKVYVDRQSRVDGSQAAAVGHPLKANVSLFYGVGMVMSYMDYRYT